MGWKRFYVSGRRLKSARHRELEGNNEMREFGSLLLVVILGHLTGNVQTNGSSRAERSVSGCHVEPPAAKSLDGCTLNSPWGRWQSHNSSYDNRDQQICQLNSKRKMRSGGMLRDEKIVRDSQYRSSHHFLGSDQCCCCQWDRAGSSRRSAICKRAG